MAEGRCPVRSGSAGPGEGRVPAPHTEGGSCRSGRGGQAPGASRRCACPASGPVLTPALPRPQRERTCACRILCPDADATQMASHGGMFHSQLSKKDLGEYKATLKDDRGQDVSVLEIAGKGKATPPGPPSPPGGNPRCQWDAASFQGASTWTRVVHAVGSAGTRRKKISAFRPASAFWKTARCHVFTGNGVSVRCQTPSVPRY